MAHLVDPFWHPTPLSQVLNSLESAHEFLIRQATKEIQSLNIEAPDFWGRAFKRISVDLDDTNHPPNVASGRHNLIEVINQCATMERLIDAVRWATVRFPEYQVHLCHPTTSSGEVNDPSGRKGNDLVLSRSGYGFLRFEVSDNRRAGNNRKEKKDLGSLIKGYSPGDRLFMVVSDESAPLLRRQMGAVYLTEECFHMTRIFEVRPDYVSIKRGI